MSDSSLRLLEEGMRRQRQGFRAHAARLYRRIGPGDRYYADALNLLGTVRFEEGVALEAAQLIERAVRESPGNAAAWSNLGGVAKHLGRHGPAVAAYRRALLLAPDRPDATQGLSGTLSGHARSLWLSRSVMLAPLDPAAVLEDANDRARRGDLVPAAVRFRRLALADPGSMAALFNLGNALRDLNATADAARLYRRTLCVAPGHGNVLNNLGLLSFNRGDWATAEARFAEAAAATPALAAAWLNRARALQKLEREPEAAAPYRRGLAIAPVNISAWCEYAGLVEDGKWAKRAMTLDPFSPQPYNRLALLATKNPGRVGVQRWLHRGAVARPDDPDAWYNIGVELGREGDPANAVRYGTFATVIRDSHALAHLNTALALLVLERFARGWRAHTRRLESPEAAPFRRSFDIPMWTTEPIEGRHLLLWGEQGIGDEVQFLTLAPHLQRLGVRLTILTEPRLRPIIRRSFPGVTVPDVSNPTGAVEDHHGADLHLALGDLPDRLNLFCGGIARPGPWIVPDPERVGKLRAGLQSRHPGKRLVGITWRSVAPKTGGRRTIPPALWKPVLAVPGLAAVSLQYGIGQADLDGFLREAGTAVDADHGIEPIEDLDGLAALVAAVDLVVCPANNTVHFAGALAKPCWTLVPTKPDWRWGLKRQDSLWYPNTRVYRQDADDDWRPVMESVARDLRTWVTG